MIQIYGLKGIRNALVGIGVSLAGLVCGATVAVKLPTPQKMLLPFAFVALIAGAVVCGFLCGRGGLVTGEVMLAAAIYALLPMTFSLILGGLDGFFLRLLIYLGMGLIAGGVAWLIPSKRRRRRYHY